MCICVYVYNMYLYIYILCVDIYIYVKKTSLFSLKPQEMMCPAGEMVTRLDVDEAQSASDNDP